jgi:predicted permease
MAVPGTGIIGGVDVIFEGRPGERLHSQIISVSPEFFPVMSVPLRAGRLFTARDAAVNPQPVVVNETFARRFFPGSSPLGRRMQSIPLPRQQPDHWEIVGVVADIREHELEREAPLMIYAIHTGRPRGWIIRTASDPGLLIPAIQRILASYMPEQPPPEVLRVRDRFYNTLAPRRFNAALIGGFALVAALLAAIGVYGVMSYLVALRAKEVGIRMALGARPVNVLAMIVKEGAVLGAIGAAVGVAGAAALTRYLSSLLLNVSPYDEATFAVFTTILLLVAIAACYLPGRRAASADPLTVLRHD